MLVLVTYDVNTETAAGRRRLRQVAKSCVNHGQRVQNSVFECLLDAAQFAVFKAGLSAMIDPEEDSLRFYQLGNNYKNRVEHVGRHPRYQQDDVLILLALPIRRICFLFCATYKQTEKDRKLRTPCISEYGHFYIWNSVDLSFIQ